MARRRKVDLVVVTCYNQQEVMERGLAIQKYLDCIMHSEGAERDRYVNIYFQLTSGAKEAWDQ
jgi:hypothetical protein